MEPWIDPWTAEPWAKSVFRLGLAAMLGGLVGFEREHTGKAAGLRTHMLVALGCALLMLLPEELGIDGQGSSRVIAGVVAGIGFLGAGAILKRTEPLEIYGLTTAASIWVTAAIGLAVGGGAWQTAIIAVTLTFVILSVLSWLEGPQKGNR
jgi:putative Mg2+ transporter-C (MgtC) family protein